MRSSNVLGGLCCGVFLVFTACDKQASAPPAPVELPAAKPAAPVAPVPPTPQQLEKLAASTQTTTPAELGKLAPNFKLEDVKGASVALSDFKGRTVVLEWFNPECPFVNRAHLVGSLKGTAEQAMKDTSVVWLAINSGAPGKQGHGAAANAAGAQKFGLTHSVLLDEEGVVGKAYGAERTPHLFIVDKEGKLVYRGAIDNSPDAEGKSPEGGKLVNYVTQALEELAAGKPVSVPQTTPYGCSVKYADR